MSALERMRELQTDDDEHELAEAAPYAIVEPDLTYREQYGTDPIPRGQVAATFERLKAALLVLLVVTGCGSPSLSQDPRRAAVVVESPWLMASAVRAAGWWYEQTVSEVSFSLLQRCPVEGVCVRVRLGELPEGKAGSTVYPVGRPSEQTTTVIPLNAELEAMNLAHEFGHVLGLGHTDGVMTSFVDRATWELPSEWSTWSPQ